MAEQDVGGIALGLTLDTTGWSSGIARAKADLEGLRRTAGNIEIGVTTRANRAAVGGPSAVAGVRPAGGGQAGAIGVETVVSPKFQVSAGSVRQLRTEINAQLRQLSAGGEAVSVPIKLGRVPYATMRSEIAAGIGEVPIRVKPDAGSLTAFAAVLSAMTGATPGRARATIQQAAAEHGIPTHAMGGPTWAGRPYLVGEKGPEIRVDRSAGMVIPHAKAGSIAERLTRRESDFIGNLRAASRELRPEHVQFGRQWYGNARAWIEQMARQYGIQPDVARGVTAALSAGTQWGSNKTKAEKVFKAYASGQPFPYSPGLNAHVEAEAILYGRKGPVPTGPKVSQFYRNLAGDFSALTLDRWALRTATRGKLSQIGRSPVREKIVAAYMQAAAEMGMDPAEYQAAVWGLEKERAGTRSGGGKDLSKYMAGGGFAKRQLLRELLGSKRLWQGYRPGTVVKQEQDRLYADDIRDMVDPVRSVGIRRFSKNADGGGVMRRLGRIRDRFAVNWGTSADRTGMGYSIDKIFAGDRFEKMFPKERGLISRLEHEQWGRGMGGVPGISGTVGDPGEHHLTGSLMSEGELLDSILGRRGTSHYNKWRRPEDRLHLPQDEIPGVVWSKNARGGGVKGYCYTCRSNVQNRFTHQSTARHQANARGGGSSRWLGQQPGWAWGYRNLDEQYADPEGYEESDEWRAHRYRGGQAFTGPGGVFPGGVDLSLLDRKSRLAIGKRLYLLGKEFPFTAASMHGGNQPHAIRAVDDQFMAFTHGVTKKQYDRGVGRKQVAGVTIDESAGPGLGMKRRPYMFLNANMSAAEVAGLGTLSQNLRDVATHEFGHAVDFTHGSLSQQSYRPGQTMRSLGYPSDYARSHPYEHFAELFLAAARGGGSKQGAMLEMFNPLREADKKLAGLLGGRLSGHGVEPRQAMEASDIFHGLKKLMRGRRKGGLADAYRSTIAHGGGSFGPGGVLPAGRYAVGTAMGTARMLDQNDPRGFMRAFKELNADSPYIGSWLHEGKIHLDPITVRRHRGDARRIGQANDQLAMFDLKRMREIPLRALGGMVDDKDPLDDFDDPIYRTDTPSNLQIGAFRARAVKHLMRQGFSAKEAGSWLDNEIHEMWLRHRPRPQAPLRLRTSGAMVDVATMGGHPLVDAEDMLGYNEGPGPLSLDPGHKLRAPSRRLPRGVKVRFSPEWTDFPDPSKFITSGGENTLPNWHDRWTGPGQLNMGYFEPQHRGAPMDRLLAGLEGAGPYFDPRGEADPIPTRYRSISEWLQSGRWGGDPKNPNSRARLMAYALDQRNRVLGHAMVSATRAVPDFGPQTGESIAALHPDYVWTHPSMRGKGLAAAMYSRLERFTGMPLMPSSSQTPHGKRLWAKPAEERAFGRMFRGRNIDEYIEDQIADRDREDTGINQYGWRAGSTAGIEPMRDFSRAVDPLTRQRVRRLKGQMRLPGFAFGGLTGALGDVGRYIVGEIGRELFVPKRSEGIIPPGVAAQLPGGGGLLDRLLSGKAPRGGGIPRDIGGRGSQVWDAPEDGWIIPNRLMHLVPRHAGGSVHPHPHPSASGKTWIDERGRQIPDSQVAAAQTAYNQRYVAGQQQVNQGRPSTSMEALNAASRSFLSRTNPEAVAPRGGFDEEAARESARLSVAAAASRGLTGRAAAGGGLAYIFGGRQRREAAAEVRVLNRELQSLLPQGVDKSTNAVSYFADALEETQTMFNANKRVIEEHTRAGKGSTDQIAEATEHNKEYAATIESLKGHLVQAQQVEEKRDKAITKSQGGAIANFASVTAAGIAFNFGMQLAQGAFDAAAKAAAPLVDRLTGFGATSQRVTKDLADALPAAGRISTLLATTGVQAGLSGAGVQTLGGLLGGSINAKAGAAKAAQQQDLLRAASSNAPTGLIGGFGGFLGGSFLAEQLGGGKGALETLAQSVSELRGGGQQPTSTTDQKLFAGFGVIDRLGQNVQQGLRGLVGLSNRQQDLFTDVTRRNERETAALDLQRDEANRALERGARDTGTSFRQFDQSPDAAAVLEATKFQRNEAERFINQMAQVGVVFKDSAGNIVDSLEEANKLSATYVTGLNKIDPNTFAATLAPGLDASLKAAAARGEFERNVAIPGQFGQQAIANPFIAGSTTAGLEQGFKPTIASLTRIQSLQRDITRDALTAVQAQQKTVTDELGAAKGAEFGGYVQQIQAYGQEIASLNNDVLNAQATASAAAYGFQLHMINRQIADAKGLAGQAGGSRLGELQREQYMLQRESQRLALQSQQLANEMSQRQINFQVAIAGFQAPGITGQERAARQHEAEVEAAYAQRQLNINKQQTGIAGQSFGVEGQIFNLQTARAVQELEMQRGLLIQQHAVEQEQIAAQKQIAALAARQAQVQAKAQSLFAEATGAFDSRLGAAASYVAQFGGTIAGALIAVRRAIDVLQGQTPATRKTGGTKNTGGGGLGAASGLLAFTGGETSITVGEVAGEAVAVLKNPHQLNIGAPGGMPAPGGGGVTVNVAITGNTISSEMDLEMITRRVQAAVEDGLGRKANLLGVNSV